MKIFHTDKPNICQISLINNYLSSQLYINDNTNYNMTKKILIKLFCNISKVRNDIKWVITKFINNFDSCFKDSWRLWGHRFKLARYGSLVMIQASSCTPVFCYVLLVRNRFTVFLLLRKCFQSHLPCGVDERGKQKHFSFEPLKQTWMYRGGQKYLDKTEMTVTVKKSLLRL